ncbi:MAG: TolC family protein, partial [Syntrophales bacterium]|nr:TolC family protein [Syntrophales bacterium]
MKLRRLMMIFSSILLMTTIHGSWCLAEQTQTLSLRESIDTALQQSMLIQASKEGVKGAEALKKAAFTGFLPRLSTSYYYTRVNPAPWAYFPGATLTPALSIPPGQFTAGTQDNYTWYLEVRQPIFAGGSINANYQASKKGEEIAKVDETTTTYDIVQEVKTSYFNILKAQKILDVARQAVEQLKSHRDEAQSFFDVGLIPKNDLLQSEVRLADGQQNLLRAENGLETAKSRLNTVLRRNINDPVAVEDILTYKPYDQTIDNCIQTAIEKRPEIKSYVLKVDQMREFVKVAKGDLMPSVNAIGHYERYGDSAEMQGTTYKSMENWYVMARADWTFWEWGKTKNQIDARRFQENQLQSLLANEKDRITFEVKTAYLQVRESEKQVFVSLKAIEQAEENFRINTERYKEQVATSLEVLDAQTLLTKTKSDY